MMINQALSTANTYYEIYPNCYIDMALQSYIGIFQSMNANHF